MGTWKELEQEILQNSLTKQGYYKENKKMKRSKKIDLKEDYWDEFQELCEGYFTDDYDSETTYEIVGYQENNFYYIFRHNCDACNNHEWKTTLHNFLVAGTRCPVCNESKGEKRVRNWLLEKEIIFSRQFEFFDLLSERKNPLKFDFALFSNDEKDFPLFLIEYDGEYHYLEGIQSNRQLQTRKKHDSLKDEYCKSHNINLIRIPYWEKDNIEKILSQKIFGV